MARLRSPHGRLRLPLSLLEGVVAVLVAVLVVCATSAQAQSLTLSPSVLDSALLGLDWTPLPLDPASGSYIVEYPNATGSFVPYLVTSAAVAYARLRLTPGSSYSFRVHAIDNATDVVSNVVLVTMPPLPSASSWAAPQVSVFDQVHILYFWNAHPADQSTNNSYLAEFQPSSSSSSGGNWTIGYVLSAGPSSFSCSFRFFYPLGISYDFRVRFVNGSDGSSITSPIASLVPRTSVFHKFCSLSLFRLALVI